MAHLDLSHPYARPLLPLKGFLAARMDHIRQLLVVSFIASATIILVAAAVMVAV